MKISLWVFKIQGFEGRIGVPKHGESLNSARTGLLNHQTFKVSINSNSDENFFVGVQKFEGLKVEFGFPSMGYPVIPPGWGC
jgi:hypothetical protein